MTTDTCNCGAGLVPSVRYEATGPHETLACFAGRAECQPRPLRSRPAPVRTCVVCGSPRSRKSTQFCSLQCAGKTRVVTRVSVTCHCGMVFEVLPRDIQRGQGKNCSRACQNVSLRLNYRKHTGAVGLAS